MGLWNMTDTDTYPSPLTLISRLLTTQNLSFLICQMGPPHRIFVNINGVCQVLSPEAGQRT